jgi:hypothetical protein
LGKEAVALAEAADKKDWVNYIQGHITEWAEE